MCQRCEEAKKRLTPEQAQELDELNENIGRLHQRVQELRGESSEEVMHHRFIELCRGLDQVLIHFIKAATEQGLLHPDGGDRAALFCPAMMLMACRLSLMAGFDLEDTVQMFGTSLQQALVQQSGQEQIQQSLHLWRVPRGSGVMH